MSRTPIDIGVFLRNRTNAILATIGERVVEETQGAIATPYPPASDPGTPPHLRTGNLHEGVTSDVREDSGAIVLSVSSNRANGDPRVPAFLEFGGRPYMRPQFDKLTFNALAEIADGMRQP
jgi:hypothetical protein